MSVPTLEKYLACLYDNWQPATRVWLDGQGRAQGRYFNATLTSAFQAIRVLGSQRIAGFEGFARSYSDSDQGLSLWRLLDHAANDDESVALDRLCRMLHAINFYRQQPAPELDHLDLYLSVHARLLAAVDGHHGVAFRRVLNALELPQEKIVLQLPLVTQNQGWLLNVVANNYRRNGFRLALSAANAQQALELLDQLRPEVIKVDAREIRDEAATLRLLQESARRGVRLIFKRVETSAIHATLLRLGAQTQQAILAQGFLWDLPAASLDASGSVGKRTDLSAELRWQASAAA
jgi:EAL domain-containing protein (putative c-di-GMP-specific phosphodiesterase class I)